MFQSWIQNFSLLSLCALMIAQSNPCQAVLQEESTIPVWPEFAPGESTRLIGEKLPHPPNENPVITRVINITSPTMTVHLPAKPNGTAAVILPGGGFGRVVPDLEGTEAASWLNELGVTAFVLHYRTTDPKSETPGWLKPVQDAQRALSLIRSQADKWKLSADKIGIVGFSAGGQATARLLSLEDNKKSYTKIDEIDAVPHRPTFAVLIYPWNMYDSKQDRLVDGIAPTSTCPPTFLVHTNDDKSSSLGAVLFYAALKKQGIPSELHVYGNGGHGYGLRPVKGSEISSWPGHAAHWLRTQGLAP